VYAASYLEPCQCSKQLLCGLLLVSVSTNTNTYKELVFVSKLKINYGIAKHYNESHLAF